MLARILSVVPLALLALAGGEPEGQCNGGTIQCCQSIQQASQASSLLQQVGLIPADVGLLGQVGVNCIPITVIGTGAGCQASQQSACCTGNNFNGLVTVGCSPINVNA
ncbi:hydrophobin [Pisolithus marmoratus]|nr:hydrophobin [Pisolithus marmoratus]